MLPIVIHKFLHVLFIWINTWANIILLSSLPWRSLPSPDPILLNLGQGDGSGSKMLAASLTTQVWFPHSHGDSWQPTLLASCPVTSTCVPLHSLSSDLHVCAFAHTLLWPPHVCLCTHTLNFLKIQVVVCFYFRIWMSVCDMHAWCPWRSEEKVSNFLEVKLQKVVKSLGGCWKLSLGPLGKQPVLLTTKPCLQLHKIILIQKLSHIHRNACLVCNTHRTLLQLIENQSFDMLTHS